MLWTHTWQNTPQISKRIIDTGGANPYKYSFPAAVAELADAQASGACVLRDVEVRLLSAAEPRIGTGAKTLGPIFLVRQCSIIWKAPIARVAELADALGLGPSVLLDVQVRLLSLASIGR
jgi:hypothetical protein